MITPELQAAGEKAVQNWRNGRDERLHDHFVGGVVKAVLESPEIQGLLLKALDQGPTHRVNVDSDSAITLTRVGTQARLSLVFPENPDGCTVWLEADHLRELQCIIPGLHDELTR